MIREGDLVLIWIDRRRKKVVKVERGKTFGSDMGVLKLDEVIGKEYGESVRLSTGVEAFLLKPTLEDVLYSFKRRTQVIYPKDIGIMLVKLGIRPGMKVLEGGTGSGFVTASLAWLGAKVYTFEKRKEHLSIALRNLRWSNLIDKVIAVRGSIGEAPKVYGKGYFDAAVIDLGDPWRVVDSVWEALKPGSPVAFWLPTFDQLEKLKEALEGKFLWQESLELWERRIKVEKGATRPEQLGISFTGFWAFARRVS